MATACQSCDTLGLLPTAPSYPGCPPAPPAQGCSAVWGSITGDIRNQTDVTAYITEVAELKSVIRLKSEDTTLTEGFPGPGYTSAQLRHTLLPNTQYLIELNLVSNWSVEEGNLATTYLQGVANVPAGALVYGMWVALGEIGSLYQNGANVNELGILRQVRQGVGPEKSEAKTRFLLQTFGTGGTLDFTFNTLGEAALVICEGSWLRIQVVSSLLF